MSRLPRPRPLSAGDGRSFRLRVQRRVDNEAKVQQRRPAASHLKEVGVAKGRAQTKDEISLGMFGYGLHDGTIDDDQVLGSSFHVTSLARIARIKEQRRPFETNPVTAPSSLPGQLHLVFLAQQPLLDAQKPVEKKKKITTTTKKPIR